MIPCFVAGKEVGDGLVVGRIEGVPDRAMPKRLHGELELGLRAARNRHVRTRLGRHLCGREPDARAAANDQYLSTMQRAYIQGFPLLLIKSNSWIGFARR